MKNNYIVLFLVLFFSTMSVADNQNEKSVSFDSSQTVKFSIFDPDDKYSYKVYERGDIVSYDGNLYEAKRAVNNNAVPKEGNFWKLLTKNKPISDSPYYHAAFQVDNFLYVSGQNAQVKNESLKGLDINQQTDKAIELISRTLEKNGYSLKDVVNVNVVLAKESDFVAFNQTYLKYFPNRPTRSTALGVMHQDMGVLVEISVIAYKENKGILGINEIL